MDTINFIIEDYVDEEQGFRFPTINIYINAKNLIDLVEQVEQRDKVLRGEELSRSQYIGLEPRRNFRDEFLGMQRRPYSIVLTCTCTMEMCNDIMTKVTIDARTVTWTELKNPWLGGKTFSPWITEEQALADGWVPFDYSGLGPFVFERDQYMNALDQLNVSK